MEHVATSSRPGAGEELQEVVSAISHDLRAPVRHINAFIAELEHELDDAQLSDDARCFIDRTVIAADLLETRLAALMTFTRIASIDVDPVVCDVEQILAGIVDTKRNDLAIRDVAVKTGRIVTVAADRDQLTAVFDELITNAMRFGGDRLSVITVDATVDGDEQVFEVSDDGDGIDNRHSSTVFKLYRRCHGASVAGTGVGLASVRRIVERHGGWIDFESHVGQGSTVRFGLPIAGAGIGDPS